MAPAHPGKPATWRSRFRLRHVAVAGLALLVSGGIAVLVARAPGHSAAARPTPTTTSPDPVATACQAVPVHESCEAIRVGGVVQRFSLNRAAKPTTRTLIVDFGGPGAAVLADARLSNLRAQTPALADVNLLVLEEPWVTADVPDECTSALQVLYRALRGTGDVRTAGDSVRVGCHVGEGRWGFTPERYLTAIQEIARTHDLAVDGFIGHSWGGVRLSYLASLPLQTVTLIRPFPIGTSKATLVTDRVRLIREQLGAPTIPAGSTELADRSVPVTSFDAVSAWAGLGYTDPTTYTSYRKSVQHGDPATIAELSDGLWRRYATDSLSPSLLAEFDEVCTTVAGPAEVPTRITTPADVLNVRMAPCAGIPVRSARIPSARSTCIVTSATDTVVPADLVRVSYRELAPKPTWLTSSAPTHVSFEGLTRCLAKQPVGKAK